MIKRLLFMVILAGCLSQLVMAQVTVSGFITDAVTGEVLVGAYVLEPSVPTGTVTNANGYFSFMVATPCTLECSFVGYTKFTLALRGNTDTTLRIRLNPGSHLNEVTVTASKRPMFNQHYLDAKQLLNVPSVSGTPDVMKAIQLMPGIMPQSEASSLLVVRGGDPGQNLYLLDKTPLIYVNHLGGFMSVFNPEMINDLTVIKGGFPAEYGGKLSSVVAITQRVGDTSAVKGSFGIGITDVNGSVEGRLGKNGSFMVTGRKTLFGLLLYGASSLSEGNYTTVRYGFHDVNAKLTWKLNPKNRFSVNLFQGDDYLVAKSKESDANNLPQTKQSDIWGNWLLSGTLQTVLTPRVLMHNAASFTRYRYSQKQKVSGAGDADFKDKYTASVNDMSWRSDVNVQCLPWWKLTTGLQGSFIQHTPYSYTKEGSATINEAYNINALQGVLFADNRFDLSQTLTLTAGARLTGYATDGFSTADIEPRLGLTWQFLHNQSMNASYMQVNQYSHLLFTAGSIASSEVWVPATKGIPAAFTRQSALGWESSWTNLKLKTGITGYFKTMSGLATYKQGEINLFGDANWPQKIETGGKGQSFGIEVFARKDLGDFTGQLSYTYSQTNRQFNGINNGKAYVFEYDRPHNVSTLLSYRFSDKWEANCLWVFQSGLPYTPVVGRQYTPSLDGVFYYEAFIYGTRNSGRLKPYHRLDVSVNYHTQTRNGNRSVWTFTVYNLYNRQNPNYYYYNVDATDQIIKPEMGDGFAPMDMYQMSLFPIIPSVSYKVYFDGNRHNKPPREKGAFFKKLLYF